MTAPRSAAAIARAEFALQRMLTAFIVTGLLFLLLPGTFLGVWNLVSIGGRHSLAALAPAWLQAHGHAQIYGWIGTFIIGIGFYSLSKMGRLPLCAAGRGWTSWALWTGGVALRWTANVTLWEWRWLLPLSAALQLAAFALFFVTVSRHKPNAGPAPRPGPPAWMLLVIASSSAFLLALLVNLALAIALAWQGAGPAIPAWLDQRYLFLAAWGFPVWAVWGFNARWLPVFLGLPDPSSRGLFAALALAVSGLAAAAFGLFPLAASLLFAASLAAVLALRVFRRPLHAAKTLGVSRLFPHSVRLAYVWLLLAAVLGIGAAAADRHGGLWGASRHALTVGFLAAMVFAIGQRVLPAFCGMRVLYRPSLMSASLVLLNLGCLLRVASEVPAYEADFQAAWKILPVSAVTELAAVCLFALNLGATFLSPPPHPPAPQARAGNKDLSPA